MDSPARGEQSDEFLTLRRHTTTSSRLTESKPSRTSRPKHLAHTPMVELFNQDVDASSLPVPVPDYGHAPAYQPTSLVIKAGFLPVMDSTVVTPDLSQPTIINSNDPVLPTADTLEPFTSTEVLEPSFYPPSRTRPIQNSSRTVVAIVMSVLGGLFLLVVFVVVARIRSRRNVRRYLRTPSLPIPQDTFPDQLAEESPIFGGKERFSASVIGKEKWTQYRSKSPLRETERDPFSDPSTKTHRSSKTLHPNEPSLKKPSFLQRSLSHISALSAYSTAKSDVAGLIANAGAPAFTSTATTADHVTAVPYSDKSEGTRVSPRQSKDKQAIRITVRDWDASSEDEYVYDGVEDPPTVIAHLPAPSPNVLSSGRERIKAPYPVGSCPSISVSMDSIAAPTVTPSNSATVVNGADPFVDPSPYVDGPSLSKIATRRERDTQALTVALGLDSPKLEPQARIIPSRGRTSVLRRSHTLAHHTSFVSAPESFNSPCPSDDGSRLGRFMLRDHRRSSLSFFPREQMPPLPPPVAPLNLRSQPNGNLASQKGTTVDDRPPRVPSPPALPSLAQMAMSQAADYETYRSPTYSLYDAYADRIPDKERDKRTTSFFGGKDRG